jgi:hypothetical protein
MSLILIVKCPDGFVVVLNKPLNDVLIQNHFEVILVRITLYLINVVEVLY